MAAPELDDLVMAALVSWYSSTRIYLNYAGIYEGFREVFNSSYMLMSRSSSPSLILFATGDIGREDLCDAGRLAACLPVEWHNRCVFGRPTRLFLGLGDTVIHHMGLYAYHPGSAQLTTVFTTLFASSVS